MSFTLILALYKDYLARSAIMSLMILTVINYAKLRRGQTLLLAKCGGFIRLQRVKRMTAM